MNRGVRGQIQKHLSGGSLKTPPEDTPTLADSGISKHQSANWQKIAEMPEGGSLKARILLAVP